MTPSDFVQRLWLERASAILRTSSQEGGARAMEAALRGGFKIVEFTLTIPGAFELVREFSARPGVVVGVGTVLRPQDARAAVEAGAKFLVSPVVDEAVIDVANELGVTCMPGTHTPTEMLRAHRAGAQLQKLFPAPAGGPAFVRACLGPMPFLRIVPTHGVDEGNVSQFFDAGVWAVGFVASLFTPEDLREGRYDRIESRARRLWLASQSTRRSEPPQAADPFA